MCSKCNFISTSSKVARNHLIKKENIKSSTRTKSTDLIYNIPVQILYPTLSKGIFIPTLPILNLSNTTSITIRDSTIQDSQDSTIEVDNSTALVHTSSNIEVIETSPLII
jgi:hypothetical protein